MPIALLVALTGAIVEACYEVPTPSCGFLCGPNDACPDSYTCAADHYCHRVGAPATLVCGTPDAGMPDTSDDAGFYAAALTHPNELLYSALLLLASEAGSGRMPQ